MIKKMFFIPMCLFLLHGPANVFAELPDGNNTPSREKDMVKQRAGYLSEANEFSLEYLEEARNYRHDGRFELARQSYLQALSICSDGHTHEIIKRELNGLELILRSKR